MRSRIDTIKAVKAREEAEKERQRKLAAFQTSSSSGHPSAAEPHAGQSQRRASLSDKKPSSFTALVVKMVTGLALALGTIFGANEAMVLLLQ